MKTKRPHRFNLNLSATELRMLKALAGDSGDSASEFFRRAICNAFIASRKAKSDIKFPGFGVDRQPDVYVEVDTSGPASWCTECDRLVLANDRPVGLMLGGEKGARRAKNRAPLEPGRYHTAQDDGRLVWCGPVRLATRDECAPASTSGRLVWREPEYPPGPTTITLSPPLDSIVRIK